MENYMRKILLATTALVTVVGVSAANAEISFSGSTNMAYSTWSDDGSNTGGNNDTNLATGGDFSASYSTTTDTGLSVSAGWSFEDDVSTASIGGDWGTISWSNDGDAMEIGQGDADPITKFITGTTTADYDGGEGVAGGELGYSSSVGGVEFGVAYTNAGATSKADSVTYGVGYSAEITGGATVSVGYGSSTTDAANTTAATTDSTDTSLNASVTVSDLTFMTAANSQKTTRVDDNSSATGYTDMSSTNFGVSYAISDSLSVSAHSRAAKGTQAAATDYKYDLTVYGLDYTIASGVALTAAFSDYTQSGTNSTAVSGTASYVRVKVSF
jgi:hypothetical protein